MVLNISEKTYIGSESEYLHNVWCEKCLEAVEMVKHEGKDH